MRSLSYVVVFLFLICEFALSDNTRTDKGEDTAARAQETANCDAAKSKWTDAHNKVSAACKRLNALAGADKSISPEDCQAQLNACTDTYANISHQIKISLDEQSGTRADEPGDDDEDKDKEKEKRTDDCNKILKDQAEISTDQNQYSAKATKCLKQKAQGLKCPNFKSLAKESCKNQNGDDSSSNDADCTGKVTACMKLTGPEKMAELEKSLSDLNDKSADYRSKFSDSQQKLSENEEKCSGGVARMRASVERIQTQLQALELETVQLIKEGQLETSAEKEKLQAQIDQAEVEMGQILNGDMAAAQQAYNEAISAAKTDCYKYLQQEGAMNKLNFSSLNDAMQAAQVGVTQYKCDRDFFYQQKTLIAAHQLAVTQQSLAMRAASVQAKINSFLKQKAMAAQAGNLRNSRKMLENTTRLANLTSERNEAMQNLTALQNSCMGGMNATLQSNVGAALKRAEEAENRIQPASCQYKFLADKGIHPATDDESKRFNTLQDSINSDDSPSRPCDVLQCNDGTPMCCTRGNLDKGEVDQIWRTTVKTDDKETNKCDPTKYAPQYIKDFIKQQSLAK